MKIHSILQENIHPLAIEVCSILQKNGYQSFIVGGCVRDLLLGVKPKDWDITSDATPEQVIELFPKTIPTGLQHGTVTVVMGEGVENHFEVTTFRVEGQYKDGRRPESVSFVKNIEQDLARRDLTINAIAFDPVTNKLMDPFDGVGAIEHQMIEAVGYPTARFQEDGLRIMRVARFAARFGWSITASTEDGMKASLDTLKKVSKERISDELSKTLMATYPSYGVQTLMECGALDVACPLLAGHALPHLSFPISKKHPKEFPFGDLETRLAFLYDRLPSKLVEQELIELKFSNKEIKRVIFLLETHSHFLMFQQSKSVSSYRKFIARLKNEGLDFWAHTLEQFIGLAEALEIPARAALEPYKDVRVPFRNELAINGNDLMEIGIKPGPQIKSLLEMSYSDVLEHPEHNYKDYLIHLVTDIKLNA